MDFQIFYALLFLMFSCDKLISSENTSITCDANSGNKSFTCTVNGRYAVPGDTTCKQYYYCYKKSNGSFTQYEYTCSIGTFNGKTQSCDKNYTCPCTTDTTTAVSSTTEQSPSTTEPSTTTTAATNITTESSTTQGTTSSTVALCDARFANTTFTCFANGRYVFPGDATCKKYYYCYKKSSGQFTQYLYTCSIGNFNKETQSCDKNYTCPCSTDSTTVVSSTTEQSLRTTEPSTTTTAATNTTTESSATQGTTSTTVAYCDASYTNTTFTCSANGRYTFPGDTTCKKYYYCYKKSSGEFTQYLYTCSIGNFNKETQSCDKNYACPCSTDSTTIVSSTTEQSTSTTEPSTTTTAATNITTESSTTQGTTSSTVAYCDARFAKTTFTCIANGRYFFPGDTTCKKYYYCYKKSSGQFTQYLYTCSIGNFNEETQSCDKNYTCPCSTDLTTVVSSTTEQSLRTTEPSTTTTAATNTTTESSTTQGTTSTTVANCDASYSNTTFTCSANGRYTFPGDTTCKKYYYCYKKSSGEFTQYLYTCSIGNFNKETQSCDKNYTCPCSTDSTTIVSSTTEQSTSTTEPSSTTTESSTTQGTTSSTEAYCDARFAKTTFTCIANGRYVFLGDTTCKKYYYCYKKSSGQFTQYIYTCSIGNFNEETQSCDKNYTCPCSTDSTTVVSSTTEQSIRTTEPSTTTTAATNTTTESSTTQGTTSTTVAYCDASYTNTTFTCSANGRYSFPGDTTCKKYYYCYKKSSGEFTQYLYTCSIGNFNKETQSCDKNYTCPCSTNSTTIVSSTTEQSTSTTEPSSTTTAATNITTESSTTQGTTSSTEAYCDARFAKTTFTCIANGRYVFPGDTTCKKYYYCYKKLSGQFTQYIYTCSIGNFNEETQSCDKNYTCPCSTDSTTVVSSTTEQSIRTTEPSTTTTAATNTTTESSTTQGTTSTTVAYCDTSYTNTTFTCSANGRYSFPGDTTCRKYYYCYKKSSGEFTQYLYTCSNGNFNEETQSCDKNYTCPCSTDSTTVVSSTTEPSTSTTEPSTTTTAFTNATTESSTTQGTTGTTVPYCDATYENTTFTCSVNGRYAFPGDSTCKKYYYCYKKSSGEFTQYLYTCSNGNFNKETRSCDKNYTCPCSTDSTTVVYSTTELSTSTTEPGTTTTAVTNATTESSTTQGTTSTTVPYCDATYENTTFTCSVNGRYAFPGDSTCKKYYYCYKKSSGEFTQYLYTCSNGNFNKETQSCDKNYTCPCSTDSSTVVYSTTEPSTSTTEPSTTTTAVTNATTESCTTQGTTSTTVPYCDATYENTTFTCSVNGRYAFPGDTTCKKYYYCYKKSSGEFTQYLYTCSNGNFNEETQSCDKNYTCPCSTDSTTVVSTTTEPSTSTTEPSSTTTAVANTTTESRTTPGTTSTTVPYCDASYVNNTFTCFANGRYAVPGDTTCKEYYYCYKKSSGQFTQYLYNCSIGNFNGETQSCDKKYTCPCSTDTTTPIFSTTKQSTTTTAPTTAAPTTTISTTRGPTITTERSTTTILTTTTTNIPSTPTTTVTTTAPTTPSDSCNPSAEFQCSGAGIFADPSDITCKWFYSCRRRLFHYVEDREFCPVGKFNPRLKICDINYKCPCNCTSDEEFSCSAVGNFRDASDATCTKYYTCRRTILGRYRKSHHTCLRGKRFNPYYQRCEALYHCPCDDHLHLISNLIVPEASNAQQIITTNYSGQVISTNYGGQVISTN